MAQLVAFPVWDRRAAGSSPVIPTMKRLILESKEPLLVKCDFEFWEEYFSLKDILLRPIGNGYFVRWPEEYENRIIDLLEFIMKKVPGDLIEALKRIDTETTLIWNVDLGKITRWDFMTDWDKRVEG